MNTSHLIGKEIYALYEGKNIGTVSSVVFNKTNSKLKGLNFFDHEDNEYFVPIANIFALCDCVLIKNLSCLGASYNLTQNMPLFKQAITTQAQNLGKIVDCVILDDGQVDHFLCANNQQILPKDLVVFSDYVLVNTNKTCKIALFKPKNYKTENLPDIKVKIMQVNQPPQEIQSPIKISFNPMVLIGKKCKSTVLGQNNEIVAKADQIITEKTILEAQKHSRINQLYFAAN